MPPPPVVGQEQKTQESGCRGVDKGRTKPERANTFGIKPEKVCSGGIKSEKGGAMSGSNKRRYEPQADGTPCPEPT